MIFPSFTTYLALILSLFTLANALPTLINPAPATTAEIAGPRSLLGRRYVRQPAGNPSSWAAREIVDIARGGPSRRADRFQAAQRRIARNPAAERITHDENLLSNQSLAAPPPETPTPAPAAPTPVEPIPQAHLDASGTSVAHVPHPTPSARAKKHSKTAERKSGSKGAKKT